MRTAYIIDDSQMVRKLIRQTIEPAKFECLEFGECDPALEHYRSTMNKPDLIIQDVEMPKRNGISLVKDFIEEKKSAKPDFQKIIEGLDIDLPDSYCDDLQKRMNVLIITANATEEVCKDCLFLAKRHIDDINLSFLCKPFRRGDLLNKIRANFFPKCPHLSHQIRIQSETTSKSRPESAKETVIELTESGFIYKYINPQEQSIPNWIRQIIHHRTSKLEIDFAPFCNCDQSVSYILDLAHTCHKEGREYYLVGLPDSVKNKIRSFSSLYDIRIA